MRLFKLEPEVSGGHGEKTVYGDKEAVERKGISAKVQYLHYEFDGWLGDELLESTPCFIISESLQRTLDESGLNGYAVEECMISVSEQFIELYPNKTLPLFRRLLPEGSVKLDKKACTFWSGHHFCLSERGDLVVTQEALSILRKHSLTYCEITELDLK